MQIENYLQRIGIRRAPRPNLSSLRALHRAHLMSIPYENLDVQLGRPIEMDIPAIYDKIVDRRRGGWCYEMNGLFGWALGELGFSVTRATGSVMREVLGDASNGNHLVLRVDLDEGVYLADVGFGDGPIEPIRITAGQFSVHGFEFDLAAVDSAWWRLRNHPRGAAPSFDFNLARADEVLLAQKSEWLQSAPTSIFVQNAICQRFSTEGISVLRGRTLRRIAGLDAVDILIGSADEFVHILTTEFALDLPEARDLWPKICERHSLLFPLKDTQN